MTVRIEPGPDYDVIFTRLCERLRLRGNDLDDAYLAVLTFENNAVLVTADEDFGRFPNLPLVDPIART